MPIGASIFIVIVTLVAVHFLLNPLLSDSPWYYPHYIWSTYLFVNIVLHFAGATLMAPGEAPEDMFQIARYLIATVLRTASEW